MRVIVKLISVFFAPSVTFGKKKSQTIFYCLSKTSFKERFIVLSDGKLKPNQFEIHPSPNGSLTKKVFQ